MKFKDKKIQISCDGGAATGKSTGAKMIAKKYKLSFLSSGLLYRYASYLLIKYNPKDKNSLFNASWKLHSVTSWRLMGNLLESLLLKRFDW